MPIYCGISVGGRVMNAACPKAKTLDDAKRLAKTDTAVILLGSITVEPRRGNAEPAWFDGDGFSLNSFGLPNPGLAQYVHWMPELQRIAKAAGKPLAVSVAGLSEDDCVTIVTRLAPFGVDLFELNFSCPNASAPNDHGGLWCFDIARMRSVLEKLSTVSSIPLAIKVSPYSNPTDIERVARMVNEADNVSAVVTSNSFPQGYWVRHGQPVLAGAYGGVAGRALHPIALGQVRQFRQSLDPHIDVAGVGGVESADDVERFVQAGASIVQVASHLMRHGHESINTLS